MKYQGHLHLHEVTLDPGGEWFPALTGWCFLRLKAGEGYWLGRAVRQSVNTGDLLTLSPQRDGSFRASRLGPVTLQCFGFCPELLPGFLTLEERHYFEQILPQTVAPVQRLGASHPVVRQLASVCAAAGAGQELATRCRLLEWAATLLGSQVPRPRGDDGAFLSSGRRIRLLMSQWTETEILNRSAAELAEQCGCSVRHFSRLFLRQFGASLRAKQTDLRLLKAQQMLLDEPGPVLMIALACGYRHLGLFNARFKRRFGTSPSEWRRLHRPSVEGPSPPADNST